MLDNVLRTASASVSVASSTQNGTSVRSGTLAAERHREAAEQQNSSQESASVRQLCKDAPFLDLFIFISASDALSLAHFGTQ